MSTNATRRRRAVTTSSWLALGLAMACGNAAFAQTTTSTTPAGTGSEATDVDSVIVVGSRASQQSSIARKKNAKTPTDSIVADDVGSFPDRNINEAISRVAGAALNRNEFGEGQGATIRGVGPEQTRIELDGLGVQSTYGLALGNAPRSADMRELPADLIKSVDVVKGSTADMTEGSLSGAVRIQTRTGLDFRKPYLSLRMGAEMNSVSEKWTPDFNIVASRKFFDDRLGVIFTGNYRGVRTDLHTNESAGGNGNSGFAAHWDWDNSAEKTYSLNPELTTGPDSAVVFANSVGNETPVTLLTKSGAAKTKQDCLTTFPYLATGSDAQKTQRINEQSTCLNQWNDYHPSLIRSFMNSQEDKRTSLDLRFDYRVSDNLTVFAKVNKSDRLTDDQNRGRGLGAVQVNPDGRFTATAGTPTNPAQREVMANAFGTGAGYYNWTNDTLCPPPATMCGAEPNDRLGRAWPGETGVISEVLINQARQIALGAPGAGTSIPIRGLVTNVDPASVVVDANHNVVSWTMNNNTANFDQIDNYQPSETQYAQIGGTYSGERLRVDFMAGTTKASSTRIDFRTSRNYNYGTATVNLQPSGLWTYELPSTFDATNPANFVQLNVPLTNVAATAETFTNPSPTPGFTAAQLPLTTNSFSVTMRPRAGESKEQTAKIDLTYDTTDMMPFFTQFKTGFQWREQQIQSWGGGGATIKDAVGTFNGNLNNDPAKGVVQENIEAGWQPPIILPSANVSGTFRACEETATSATLDDGVRGSAETSTLGLCNFGFRQPNPYARQGVDTLTTAQLSALLVDTLEFNGLVPFNSFGGDFGPGWSGIQTGNLFSQLGQGQFTNLDCLKFCTASDGKVYAQPVNQVTERTMNAYYMVEFEQENLPFGMTFNGNIGLRGVHVTTEGRGQMVLNSTRVVGTAPNGAPLLSTQVFRQNVSLQRQTIDWLPSYNLNLWVLPDTLVVRYYTGKQVSRPNFGQLTATGTCTIDERNQEGSPSYIDDGSDANGCSGNIGNPALRPFTSTNQSWNLEWYPNRDTTFALTWQEQDIKIGGVRVIPVSGPLFAGSSEVDPVTGLPLSELLFNYNTYENTPGFRRSGIEFTAKTAFTFLPWLFRHTGADFNISTLKTDSQADPTRDPITGDIMPPANESDYYTNLSLWYDDGRTQVRVSYQGRAESFGCITPCSGNQIGRNFPGTGLGNVNLPYYPGQPRYNDETKYWDAKISHNLNPNIQIFVEGTNLTKQAQTNSTGEYRPYEDGTPRLMRIGYNGYRVRTGVTFKFQ